MPKVFWFTLGFGLALVIAGTAVLGMFQPTSASDATPLPTQTVAAPTATPEPTAEPTPSRPRLSWSRQGALSAACASLDIVEEGGSVLWGPCAEGPRLEILSGDELAAYLVYVTRFRSFSFEQSADGRTERLSFVGRGTVEATPEQRTEMARWAAALYERLLAEEQRADTVARVRLALASRLGISADEIRTVSVERVDWPDACLSIRREGLFCAQVVTPGYRVLLQADGQTYEYHTDLYELVRAAETAQTTPTAQPTPSPAPTQTPLPPAPTATPYPTATPWPTATTWPPTPYPIAVTEWLGEYYANPTLQGAPVLARNDKEVSYDWGYSSAGYPVPSDNFSVRWRRAIRFTEGHYKFRLQADDGVRLWVAGNLLIDRWHGGYTEDEVIQQIWTGSHEIVVEYYELQGIAKVRLTWEKVEQRTTPTPEPTITAWRAEYYTNTDLIGAPRIVRDEVEIAMDWREGSPDAKIPSDRFSARFTRWSDFSSGKYRFHAIVDDGVRVWIDGELLIDGWERGIRRTYTGDISLTQGGHHVCIEYLELTGGAVLYLSWEHIGDYEGVLLFGSERPEDVPLPHTRAQQIAAMLKWNPVD